MCRKLAYNLVAHLRKTCVQEIELLGNQLVARLKMCLSRA